MKNSTDSEMSYFMVTLKILSATIVAAMLDYLLPIRAFIAITMMLVVFDLITGTQAAKKRGEVIHSKGLRRTILKFISYSIAILAAHAIEHVYFSQFPMVFTVSAYISVTEFFSVLENVGTITGTNVIESVRNYLTTQIHTKK